MAADLLDRRLPKDRPASFELLDDDEKRVRGRYFLMVYAMGASVEYAWFHAMSEEADHSREMRTIVDSTADEEIDEALRLRDVPGRPVMDWSPTT